MHRRVPAGVFTIWTVLTVLAATARAQQAIPGGARSADGLWSAASDAQLPAVQRRRDLDGPYAVVQLNRAALDIRLAAAPLEAAVNRAAGPDVIVTLPLPDGRFSRFRVEESPILDPALGARFPEIRTYRGVGLDDPTASARLDVTPAGFHAQIIAAGGTILVDPYADGDLLNHVTFDKASLARPDRPFEDRVVGVGRDLQRVYNELPIANGTTLRTYTLALAATHEYTVAAGGTKGSALARMTTTMNRVNGIYERELAVRMTVLTGPGGGTDLIYDTSADPYTNDDGVAMLTQNQSTVDGVIGSGNYDVGHVFSTGGGGVAGLGVVCAGGSKARGVTGSSSPAGDAFDVDYVAHELGHQFGGDHTFNSSSGSCGGGNRSASHAFEVGSGSTIMAYAGICSPENTQRNSHDIFTFESLNEITAFITSGGGSSCADASATGNTLPLVSSPGASFTIPASTPFALTAAATDGNGDSLTYLWEENDLGTASNGNANVDDGSRPLFRSYAPTSSPTRTFPSLAYILNNANAPPATYTCSGSTCIVGEVLPSTSRTLKFQVTVRDNRSGGGGIGTAQTLVSVNAATGPFAVTSPDTGVSWPAGSAQTITWSVNGSQALATHVAILLSTDGGATFPVTLAAGTPNDGTEVVTLPATATTTARIKVAAVGNIFFDISNANFTISAVSSPPGAFYKTAPGNGATGVALAPTLAWVASAGAASYEYCIDTSANATCDASWISAGTATSVTPSGLLPGTTYSWQIRAVNVVGNTQADAGGWVVFTTLAVSNPRSDVIIDFGPGVGLWAYYDHAGAPSWRQWHGTSPSLMTGGDLDGNGRADAIVNFPGFGVWAYMNDSAWTSIHPTDVTTLAAGDVNGNGRDDVIVTFAGYGLWIRYDDGTWAQINAGTPTALAVGNTDGTAGADIVAAFSSGTYVYRQASGWSLVHSLPAVAIRIGDVDGTGIGDIVLQFAGYGEWVRYNNASWAQIHGAAAAGYLVLNLDGDPGQKADIVVSFPGFGLWAFMNNASWVPVHGTNPAAMAAGDLDGNGSADLVLAFSGYGIWVYQNQTTWTAIHGLVPEGLVIGRVNGN